MSRTYNEHGLVWARKAAHKLFSLFRKANDKCICVLNLSYAIGKSRLYRSIREISKVTLQRRVWSAHHSPDWN